MSRKIGKYGNLSYSVLTAAVLRGTMNNRNGGMHMTRKFSVPEHYTDVCAEICRRRKRILTRCGIWATAALALEYLYLWEYFETRIGWIGAAVLAVALLVIYPVKIGVLPLITDRGWEGRVRDVKKRSYIHFTNLWNRSFSGMTTRVEGHVYLYGREGRSPLLEKYVPHRHKFVLRDGAAELPYRAGDTLRCYIGGTYPVIVKRQGEDGYPPRVCIFCGKTECDREREVCDFCGFSLITPEETVNFVEYGM